MSLSLGTTGVSFVEESTVLVAGPARPTEQTCVDDFEPHVEVVEGPKGALPNVVASIFILIGIVDKPTRVTTVGDNKLPLILLRSVGAVQCTTGGVVVVIAEDKGFSFSFDGIKENVTETITVYNHERVDGVEGVCLNDFKIVWTTLGMHSGVVAFEADEDVLCRWSPASDSSSNDKMVFDDVTSDVVANRTIHAFKSIFTPPPPMQQLLVSVLLFQDLVVETACFFTKAAFQFTNRCRQRHTRILNFLLFFLSHGQEGFHS